MFCYRPGLTEIVRGHRYLWELGANLVYALKTLIVRGEEATAAAHVHISLHGEEKVQHELVLLGKANVHDCLTVELVAQADLVYQVWEGDENALGEQVVVSGVVQLAHVEQGFASFATLVHVEVDELGLRS